MAGGHRVLPLLESLCTAIDQLFIEAVGPFGQLVATEARTKWVAGGHRIRTRDVEDYIALLAREIPEVPQRIEFVTRARALIGQH
jgi:hypothetical protein